LHGPLGVGAFWVKDPTRFESTRLGWRSQNAMDLEGAVTLKPEASRFEIGTVDAGAFHGLRQPLAVHRRLGSTVAQRVRALLASRNAPELDEVVKGIKRSGGHALAQTADVADERQVQDLALATARWVGPASILVNCAGMVDPMAPLARSDAALWLRNIAINVG